MKASWSEHIKEEGVVDLFEPTHAPRDLAIGQVLRQAVEHWIADEMEDAVRMVSLAEDYLEADNERFETCST